jgi:hypothetical protein
MSAAFNPVDLTIEYVDSVCGSGKTLTAVAVALDRAGKEGVKTLVAMPTLRLIAEMSEVARRQSEVPVTVITSERDDDDHAASRRKPPTTALLTAHLVKARAGGELLFITHETFFRMGVDWPAETADWELLLDEAPETVLTRAPFRLYDSWRVLTAFLALGDPIVDSPGLRRSRERAEDAGLLRPSPSLSPRSFKRWNALSRRSSGSRPKVPLLPG